MTAPFLVNHSTLRNLATGSQRACRNPRSHSLFVNLMLPGESLALHRDVPEFWGLGHYNAPHWLLHLMANSSLFDNFRLPLATCVYWVSAPPGGDLILQLHAGFEEHIQAQSNDAVIFDADAIPHRVAPVGGGATARALTRDNATLSSSGLDGWELTSSAGCLKFPSEALRISMVYKASCLCAVERCWANGSPISLESAVFQLASSLEYEDKIGGIADPEGLLKAIFKSFLGSPK